VIDPVPLHEGDEAHLRELGGVAAVLLTGPASPEARDCATTFGCPLLAPAHPPAAPPLPAALQVIPLATDDGAAYYHPGSRSLFAGAAAVAGDPAGRLRLPSPESADAAGAARRLRALLAFPAARLLLSDGASLPHDPASALQDLLYRHDPAACLLRPEELLPKPKAPGGGGGRRYYTRDAACARLLGLTAHDFDVTTVPPGRENWPLHRHDGSDELFIILEGEGELRTERGVFPVRAGDMLGFPPRYQVAHALRNTGPGDLRYLSFSAPAEQLNMNDYPESGQRSEYTPYGKSHRFFRPERMDVGYWENTPTD
jgi:uncharacterized cupin superfamily protein